MKLTVAYTHCFSSLMPSGPRPPAKNIMGGVDGWA